MATDKTAVWSGFWPRLIAYIADTIILGAVCYAVGMLALDYFSSLGSGGRAFGLVLGTLYFGLTGSAVFGGRSIGMRLLGLKVVGVNGRPLGLPAAFGRALLLVAPLMLNGWFFPVTDPVLIKLISVIAVTAVFGVCLAQLYLLLFNWPTRRLVHDLVFGAVVVRADATAVVIPKGRVQATVAAVLVVAAFGLGLGGAFLLKTALPKLAAEMGPLQRVQAAVTALPEVREIRIVDNTATTFGHGGASTTTRTLVVTARLSRRPADADRERARIGSTVVKAYAFAPGQRLNVQITYGFDLGYASYTTGQGGFVSTQCATPDVTCLVE